MQIRVFQLHSGGASAGSRRGGLLLGLLALGAGALLLVFGLVLLASLAAVGVVAGAGALLFRGLRGLRGGRRDAGVPIGPPDGWQEGLDPRLEVRADAEIRGALPDPDRR